jgi:hypothetical protein
MRCSSWTNREGPAIILFVGECKAGPSVLLCTYRVIADVYGQTLPNRVMKSGRRHSRDTETSSAKSQTRFLQSFSSSRGGLC